jgi:hypothetical protein
VDPSVVASVDVETGEAEVDVEIAVDEAVAALAAKRRKRNGYQSQN